MRGRGRKVLGQRKGGRSGAICASPRGLLRSAELWNESGALLGSCATEQKNRISGCWCVQTATAPALLLLNLLRTSKRPGSPHLGRCSLASLRSSSRHPPKPAAAAEVAEVAEDSHRASSQPTRIT